MNQDSDNILPTCCGNFELPPADLCDPVIEVYKRDIDRTLLRENLKLSPAQRAEKLSAFMDMVAELREAGQRSRAKNS
jgi:hypothetical protein